MAWAERLDSGRYRGLYRDRQGRKRSTGRETFTHKSKALAAAHAAEERARRRRSADPKDAKRLWGEWARAEWWPARDVEPDTLVRDDSRMRTHLEPQWAEIPVGDILDIDVEDWDVKMKRAGVGPATRNRAIRLFSASMRYAQARRIIEDNPCAGFSYATETKGQERFLTRDEFQAIVEQLPTTYDQLIALTLIYTGMRWSELAGLHWHRVDLGRGQIVVAETFQQTTTRIKGYPKGKKPRSIPLVPALQVQLASLERSAERTCGVPHTSGICRSGLVFTSAEGNALRNAKWSGVWRKAVKDAGLEGVRIHDLRHTYASWLLQEGVPIAEVSRLLGHASIVTTERYAHLAEVPSEAVLAALAATPLLSITEGEPT